MSSYLGYQRELEDTRNAVGFIGDDMFRYMGPGEDMMPTDPDYPAFTRYAAGKRLSVETHVGFARPAPRRLRGREHRLPDQPS